MNRYSNPSWWSSEYDSSWERIKAAMQRDWEQTKHDFGGDQPDTDQNVNDTVKQAMGKQPIPPSGVQTVDEDEEDYRFGYGARKYYGTRYEAWTPALETELRRDWESAHPERTADWDRRRRAIQYGYQYK